MADRLESVTTMLTNDDQYREEYSVRIAHIETQLNKEINRRIELEKEFKKNENSKHDDIEIMKKIKNIEELLYATIKPDIKELKEQQERQEQEVMSNKEQINKINNNNNNNNNIQQTIRALDAQQNILQKEIAYLKMKDVSKCYLFILK